MGGSSVQAMGCWESREPQPWGCFFSGDEAITTVGLAGNKYLVALAAALSNPVRYIWRWSMMSFFGTQLDLSSSWKRNGRRNHRSVIQIHGFNYLLVPLARRSCHTWRRSGTTQRAAAGGAAAWNPNKITSSRRSPRCWGVGSQGATHVFLFFFEEKRTEIYRACGPCVGHLIIAKHLELHKKEYIFFHSREVYSKSPFFFLDAN